MAGLSLVRLLGSSLVSYLHWEQRSSRGIYSLLWNRRFFLLIKSFDSQGSIELVLFKNDAENLCKLDGGGD